MRRMIESRRGFSLVELLMIVGLGVILMALAIPSMGLGTSVKVSNAANELRGALQSARLRAVAVNHALELRLNCPSTGQYRIVEAGFSETGRCNPTTYPYPPPSDAAYRTPPKPRYDGPVYNLNPAITLNASDPTLVLQFLPDGQVKQNVSGTATLISTVSITVGSGGYSKTITINNLGKVLSE
jgi:Tfp pilus assembly protein FimT